MSIFNIDYTKLVKMLLPAKLLKVKIMAFAQVIISPIVSLHALFLDLRDAALYELNHNGQVCYLEGVLTDRFDFLNRRIYIDDGAIILNTWVYRREEVKPIYVRRTSESTPYYLRRTSEISHGGTFVVHVPVAVTYDGAEMRALINKYKLAGKQYSIINF